MYRRKKKKTGKHFECWLCTFHTMCTRWQQYKNKNTTWLRSLNSDCDNNLTREALLKCQHHTLQVSVKHSTCTWFNSTSLKRSLFKCKIHVGRDTSTLELLYRIYRLPYLSIKRQMTLTQPPPTILLVPNKSFSSSISVTFEFSSPNSCSSWITSSHSRTIYQLQMKKKEIYQ